MVFEKIKEIIMEEIDIDASEITLETNLREDLNADSLDLFQVINEVEDAFDIKIEDTETMVTVGDVVAFVEKAIK